MDKRLKRRANLLYRLRKKQVRVSTQERTIYSSHGYAERVKGLRQARALIAEYGFVIQTSFWGTEKDGKDLETVGRIFMEN
jgi:hypothetical protein